MNRTPAIAALFILATGQLTGAATISSIAEVPLSDEYVLRTWESDEGLPNNNVSEIGQSSDGYLWLSTQSGLARFDGLRFTTFLEGLIPGLENSEAEKVLGETGGDLWLGLANGALGRLRNGRGEIVTGGLPPRNSWAALYSLARDAEGAVWIGHSYETRAFRWLDGKVTDFSTAEGLGLGWGSRLRATSQGSIWCAFNHGCAFFDGKRFQIVEPGGGDFPQLAPSRDGKMWAVRGNKLLRYNEERTREWEVDVGWLGKPGQVTSLFEDRAGTLWIGTSGAGLLRFRDGIFARVPLSHSDVAAIYEDREGNLWVGTNGGGLNRLSRRTFFIREASHGLHTDATISLCEDEEGKLWLLGRDGVPVRSLDAKNRAFATPPGWAETAIGKAFALISRPSGGVRAAGSAGVEGWNDKELSRIGIPQFSTAMLTDRQGNLWVATQREGLLRWRDGQVVKAAGPAELEMPRSLAEDADGRIWVGTESGMLLRQKEENFFPVHLPGARTGDAARFIVPDPDGSLWIGMFQGGLYRWREGQVDRLPRTPDLPAADLRLLQIAPDGTLWIGTASGLFSVPSKNVRTAMDRQLPARGVIAYGRDDGLPSLDFSLGFRNATTRTRDGHLWFGTTRGALELNTGTLIPAGRSMPVLIEEVWADGLLFPPEGEEIKLPARVGAVEIRYTLPRMSGAGQLGFRYRLHGLSDQWITAGNQRTAVFPRLPPGDYRFEVAALERDGSELPPVGLAFTIPAVWWQTRMFEVVAYFAGLLALVWLVRVIVSRRLRARMRKLKQENALERERTRIARDMHDGLGASLTQITLASQLAKLDPPSETAGHMDEIAAIARRSVTALDEIVWAVNPRNDTLPALLDYLGQHAVDLLASTGVACEVEVPQGIPPYPLSAHARHHIYLTVMESLTNVVKHAEASAVSLVVALAAGKLRIVLSDNGRGFEPGSERVGANGLRNIRERMAELGGTCRIESGPEKGTRVTFELPVPAGHAPPPV